MNLLRKLDLWWYRLWWKIGFRQGAGRWPEPEWVPERKP